MSPSYGAFSIAFKIIRNKLVSTCTQVYLNFSLKSRFFAKGYLAGPLIGRSNR